MGGGSAAAELRGVEQLGFELDEDDADIEEVNGDSGSEDGEHGWDTSTSAVPIFSTQGVRRLFKVQRTMRAVGNFRPSFEYFGHVVELDLQNGEELETAGAGERMVERDLTLSLRYEPPSPKFTQKCPQCTSYRLKVSRGVEFLYSTRGMHKQLVVSKTALVAIWGNLELKFEQKRDLSTFLNALKYVEVTENPLALKNRTLGHLQQIEPPPPRASADGREAPPSPAPAPAPQPLPSTPTPAPAATKTSVLALAAAAVGGAFVGAALVLLFQQRRKR
mmetsp:Transcript_22296/g.72313  ORF Transcript_22296/g.72313 Transcript_22296/m.72313 type:complete len:277 (-) Transcript_22296:662-1492(-)|eukprot:CAMPEP_0170132750 /NCGR_PEP_ID=MMETSP0033_2-20121228/766_1 /TAXON_ID=195969 /ORGANISM="Dolichomastix tenuilepis, Strain CCMP3274" /LENGTH=276 /DNA_ID=CAMNT_0010368175 /DNA_START=14 /DNA_END=844 /DNA_ORIENTATION=+